MDAHPRKMITSGSVPELELLETQIMKKMADNECPYGNM